MAASNYKYFILRSHRSSRPEVLCEEGVHENFTKFTGKRLCQSLFLIKLQAQVLLELYPTTGFLLTTFSHVKRYNFSVLIRYCVHISIIGLNSLN